MKKTEVKIYTKEGVSTPKYSTSGSAGMDLIANINTPITLLPHTPHLIHTGVHIELPLGMEAQLRPRSGLALKKGISIPNSPATIDSDYRGEIGVILINLTNEEVIINPKERIAQMVITRYETVDWLEVTSLQDLKASIRSKGGFGSTGQF